MLVIARLVDGEKVEDAYDAAHFMSTASPMVIGNQLAQTITGANHAINHMLNGDENERSSCIQGSARDVIDMYDGAKKRGSKFATMQFVVAPKSQMTREHFLQHVLPRLAKRFGFGVLQAVVFEHEKERAAGADVAGRLHWHIIVNYRDPVTGKVNPGWSWSHAKCECVSREIEALGLDGDSRILLGRFQKQVIKQLRSEGLHAIADLIEAAHPANATPENRTPPPEIEQPAKAAGIDLRELSKAVKAAFYASSDRSSFIAQLAEIGLELGVSNRSEKPAWVILGGPDGSTFINTVSRCLPGVKRASIHLKLGEPENVGSGEDHGHERCAQDDRNLGRDQSRHGAVAAGAALVPDAAAQPGGSAEPGFPGDGRAEQLFVEALGELDRDTSVLDRLLEGANALCWGTAATFLKYMRQVEAAARRWLDHRISKYAAQRPAATTTLLHIRAEGKKITTELGNCNVAVLEASSRISRMLGQPAPSIVGTKAHKDRMAEAQKEYETAEAAQKVAAAALKEHEEQARIYEDNLLKQQARWDAKMDGIANKWLAVAGAALETMKRFPRIVQYGPEAILSLGMSHYGKPAPQPKPSDDDEYSSEGPRGPK